MTATYGERVHEGERLRIANIQRLLGWDENQTLHNQLRFRTMRSLLFGNHIQLNVQVAQHVLTEIILLHSLFCKTYRLGPKESRLLRVELRAQISRKLIDTAGSTFRPSDKAVVRNLLHQSCRLYWAVVLRKQFARAVLKLFAASLIRWTPTKR